MGWISCDEREPELGFYPVIRKIPGMDLFLDYSTFDGDAWADDALFRGRVVYWYEFGEIPKEQ